MRVTIASGHGITTAVLLECSADPIRQDIRTETGAVVDVIGSRIGNDLEHRR